MTCAKLYSTLFILMLSFGSNAFASQVIYRDVDRQHTPPQFKAITASISYTVVEGTGGTWSDDSDTRLIIQPRSGDEVVIHVHRFIDWGEQNDYAYALRDRLDRGAHILVENCSRDSYSDQGEKVTLESLDGHFESSVQKFQCYREEDFLIIDDLDDPKHGIPDDYIVNRSSYTFAGGPLVVERAKPLPRRSNPSSLYATSYFVPRTRTYETEGGGSQNFGWSSPQHYTQPRNYGWGYCFLPGTLVNTPMGPIPIEDLEVGMPVYAFDRNAHEVVIVPLEAAPIEASADALYEMHFADENTLVVTQEHPIYTRHWWNNSQDEWQDIGRYLPASSLNLGTVVQTIDMSGNLIDEDVALESFSTIDTPNTTVYNLTVPTFHSFFANGILVHNKIIF